MSQADGAFVYILVIGLQQARVNAKEICRHIVKDEGPAFLSGQDFARQLDSMCHEVASIWRLKEILSGIDDNIKSPCGNCWNILNGIAAATEELKDEINKFGPIKSFISTKYFIKAGSGRMGKGMQAAMPDIVEKINKCREELDAMDMEVRLCFPFLKYNIS
jgi:hypothetical protein